MTSAQRRYLAIETGIAAVINAVLSLIFVLLVFDGLDRVPALGDSGLAFDALPQSFMVALMSALVPAILTRKRLRARLIDGASPPAIGAIVVRAVIVAVLAALVLTALQFALLRIGPESYPFGPVLVAKMLYGAILGAAIARGVVRRMLTGRAA